MEFIGWERKFAFLRADVLFPIISLDFLRFFGMQVNPSSSEVLVPSPSQRSQEGGTDGGDGRNAANVCFLAKKEAPVPQPKAAAGARPIHPRIEQLLEEFPGLVGAAVAAPQPRHGVVHHIETNGRPVFAKAWHLELAKRKVAEVELAALKKQV
jgi:hypothetical protein